MEYVYYCRKCNNLETSPEKDGNLQCSSCGESMMPLKVSQDEWNELSNEEMLNLINKPSQNTLKKPKFDTEEVNNNLMKCPACGHMISKKARSCPQCGYVLDDHKEENVATTPGRNTGIVLIIIGILLFIACFSHIAAHPYGYSALDGPGCGIGIIMTVIGIIVVLVNHRK
jgi:ribosomal protein L32